MERSFRHIGIIGAMESEVSYLTQILCDKKEEQYFGYTFYTGMIGNARVTVVQCGVGKVNAARCTQILIDRFMPDAVVNTGIAGALAPELRVGDVVAATGLVQHDFDLSGIGFVKGAMSGTDTPDRPTVFETDPVLRSALKTAAQQILPEAQVTEGLIATGDVFVSSDELKKSIRDGFGAKACEMEGGAVAQTAGLSKVPFAVMRVLSDQADGGAPESFETFEIRTAKQSAMIAERFVRILCEM